MVRRWDVWTLWWLVPRLRAERHAFALGCFAEATCKLYRWFGWLLDLEKETAAQPAEPAAEPVAELAAEPAAEGAEPAAVRTRASWHMVLPETDCHMYGDDPGRDRRAVRRSAWWLCVGGCVGGVDRLASPLRPHALQAAHREA